jgi:hypothetical protein
VWDGYQPGSQSIGVKSSVIGYSLDSNNMSIEAEESPLLRSITGKQLVEAD